jgi:hypothetical protein
MPRLKQRFPHCGTAWTRSRQRRSNLLVGGPLSASSSA